MKKIVLTHCIIITIILQGISQNDTIFTTKELKLLSKNKIERFVKLAGSEENAIDKLMSYRLPDTILNDNINLIWRTNSPRNLIELDYYASRKLQSYFWIIKIYQSDYGSRINKYCQFLDNEENPIWDYKDLNLQEKKYYYQVVLSSQVDTEYYYLKLGYVKTSSIAFEQLQNMFRIWHSEMKNKGLDYLRKNNIMPIDSLFSYREQLLE